MTSTPSPPRLVTVRDVPDHEPRFRELFEEHFRELLGYALRRVGSPEDAADVVAETMLGGVAPAPRAMDLIRSVFERIIGL